MITVGISESDAKIKQLAARFFPQHGLRCGTTLKQTDKDFIFCTPKRNANYDILIENSAAVPESHADYIHLVNSDDISVGSVSEPSVYITYGLNSYATATASSLIEDGSYLRFQYCLQRNIVSLKGKIIECQEFPVSIYQFPLDIHSALAFTTLALTASIPPAKLSKIILPETRKEAAQPQPAASI